MHYCDRNFKTKKELKDRVTARVAYLAAQKLTHPVVDVELARIASQVRPVGPVTVYNPEAGLGQEPPTPENGKVCVGGPHFPEPHKWYAEVTLQNGEVVKVK